VPCQIERALPEDAADLARLHAQALPHGWDIRDFEASCADEQRLVLKASDGVCLLGLLVLQHAAGEGEILTLAVSDQVRRQGVATMLLKLAIEACHNEGIEALYLEVGEHNGPALGLYESAGFKTITRRENYYQLARSAPETALIMKLDTKLALTQMYQARGRLESGGEHGRI